MKISGSVDRITRDRIAGWAQDPDWPGRPVSLLVTVDDLLVRRILANQLRDDLRRAGIGDGRHSFDVPLQGVSPDRSHVIAVCRETDGVHLRGSPVVLEPSSVFDAGFRAYCADVLSTSADAEGRAERLTFLAEQTEALLLEQARTRARLEDRAALQQIKWRRRPEVSLPEPAPRLAPRALVIDEWLPVMAHDAGSNAIMSHMRSLQRLGYEVSFAAADMARDSSGMLEASGISHCHAPWHGSVEEVLRREAHSFDLVYLHRAGVAARYIALARLHQPKARIVYSVADLHHLRLARQAKMEDRPELLALARQYQVAEYRTAAAANAVITHSSYEAALLRRHLPAGLVHVVPWDVPVCETMTPFAERHGVGFVGHFGHAPNLDAAVWLINDIMPRVRECDPSIGCLLAGSLMPDALRQPAPGIEALGQVQSTAQVFDRVRLTIAPMTYGAGVKGKVLESLAAGIPCVCTPIAAEGLDLPDALQALVAGDIDGLVARVVRLHGDAAYNSACALAGLAWAADALSEPRIDEGMRAVAGVPAVTGSWS